MGCPFLRVGGFLDDVRRLRPEKGRRNVDNFSCGSESIEYKMSDRKLKISVLKLCIKAALVLFGRINEQKSLFL